jgi:hypothetical protein
MTRDSPRYNHPWLVVEGGTWIPVRVTLTSKQPNDNHTQDPETALDITPSWAHPKLATEHVTDPELAAQVKQKARVNARDRQRQE